MKLEDRIVTSVELQQAGIEVYPEHFEAQVDGFELQDKKTLRAMVMWLEERAKKRQDIPDALTANPIGHVLRYELKLFKAEFEETS